MNKIPNSIGFSDVTTKEMTGYVSKLDAMNIKVIYFRSPKLVHGQYCLLAYNVELNRFITNLVNKPGVNTLPMPFEVLSVERLKVFKKLASKKDLKDVLTADEVYAILDKSNYLSYSSNPDKSGKITLEEKYSSGFNIIYNPKYQSNNYPEYIISGDDSVKVCASCGNLVIDKLGYAMVQDKPVCYKCALTEDYEFRINDSVKKHLMLYSLSKED